MDFRSASLIHRNVIRSSKGNIYCANIGLEIHCQLKLGHKLFSPSSALPGKPPNTNVSMFDAAMPGSLPILNLEALKLAIKAGLALSANIPKYTSFDRKHYFYPDLPAGYQITQYYEPIAKGGNVVLNQMDGFTDPINVGITQIQLEMDSGKSITGTDLIDLNRAGVAVLEIVSRPDLTSFEESIAFTKKIQKILTYQKIIDMSEYDEAAVRSDFNISVRRMDQPLGTRTELKHITKMNSLKDCVNYEINRQISILDQGLPVKSETRGIDIKNGTTFTLRDKESGKDYRFMPEPDVPRIPLANEYINLIRKDIYESLELVSDRLLGKYALPLKTAKSLMTDPFSVKYFEKVVANRPPELVANWIIGEVYSLLRLYDLSMENFPVNHSIFGELIDLVQKGSLSRLRGKNILAKLMSGSKQSPLEIARECGWLQINDDSITEMFCRKALQENFQIVDNYNRAEGELQKERCIKALIGKTIRISKGTLDPKLVKMILQKLLRIDSL